MAKNGEEVVVDGLGDTFSCFEVLDQFLESLFAFLGFRITGIEVFFDEAKKKRE